MKINDLTIDFFKAEDIDPFVSYWFDPPPGFWESRGAMPKIKLTRDEMAMHFRNYAESKSTKLCTVVYQDLRLGAHTLTHIRENSAIMHAHYWDESMRGKGLGTISYVKAMDWFFDKNGFEKIIFNTPKGNPATNKLKEKLGIPIIGDCIFESEVLAEPIEAWHSEVTPNDLPGLYSTLKKIYG